MSEITVIGYMVAFFSILEWWLYGLVFLSISVMISLFFSEKKGAVVQLILYLGIDYFIAYQSLAWCFWRHRDPSWLGEYAIIKIIAMLSWVILPLGNLFRSMRIAQKARRRIAQKARKWKDEWCTKINIIIAFFITSCICFSYRCFFQHSMILRYIFIISIIAGLYLSLSLEEKRAKCLFALVYILSFIILFMEKLHYPLSWFS